MCKSSTFKLAFLGSLLLWAAFPPVDFWALAWIAPVPWVLMIRRQELDGRRPYFVLWLAGFAFWLAALHWLRLPYWATGFGWVALAAYFAFYVPVFVGLSRTAVHQVHVPVILAAPVVWTGLELARGHLLTGMTMASLGHTQYRFLELIQISDLAWAYGVSYVVMFVAACLAAVLPCGKEPRKMWPILPAMLMLAAVLGYGYVRIAGNETSPGARIALIQGSIDSQFGRGEQLREEMFQHYLHLSLDAVEKYGRLDLIVWPEAYFAYPLILYDADAGARDPEVKKAGLTLEQFRQNLRSGEADSRRAFANTAAQLRAPMLVGLDAEHYTADGMRVYNTAAYISASGELLGRYDKMHLVTFGEYIPFARYFKWLHNFSPLTMDITAGTQPAAFKIHAAPASTQTLAPSAGRDILIAPNICFESVLPHVIRRQINILKGEGKEPDVLVNMTNDGWFWGSSELDMHLACGVFRAVEFRKAFLIAANTGFSAWIDADGRIIEQGPRRSTATLLAEVRVDHRRSWYLAYGDWPAGACLACCGVFACAGCWNRYKRRARDMMRKDR
jgi:apolipoprotein N-acyltransferase